ncbi:uncharacterized protein MELLADRAFT_103941 [Melampsora larici-populina 98AG31]|uniref:Secreted protein n=1 Tax=Melampsora larici-populina (strain 98AG31 / pathotype 3-4-7) TaxID=747676 RepID=F4RD24_MELLP|nr:uncharacterized protein MELLADRAFT_103941 [Melampsora larici-populina 98AG31]EGG09889.1 hypothetical protein MELLADRAFT_103941 [Melampsora larici-populina 98AG31]
MFKSISIRSFLLSCVLGASLSSTLASPPKDDNVLNLNVSATSKDSIINTTEIPTLDNPNGLNFNKSDQNVSESDNSTFNKSIPCVKLPETMNSTTTSIPISLSIPGVLSEDGKCTCPGLLPMAVGPHATNGSKGIGSSSSSPTVKAEIQNTTSLSTQEFTLLPVD